MVAPAPAPTRASTTRAIFHHRPDRWLRLGGAYPGPAPAQGAEPAPGADAHPGPAGPPAPRPACGPGPDRGAGSYEEEKSGGGPPARAAEPDPYPPADPYVSPYPPWIGAAAVGAFG